MAANPVQKDIDQLDARIKALTQAIKTLTAQQEVMGKVMVQVQKGVEEVDKRVDAAGKGSTGSATDKQLAITEDRSLRTHVALGNLVKRVMEIENKMKASK